MKLTNEEVWNSREPLLKLMEERLPVKAAYSLAKLASKLRDQYEVVEEVRNGLVKTYGGKDGKGQIIVATTSKNYQKFLSELDELMDTEIEIVFDKVSLPEKVDDRTIVIEPSILLALERFVEV